MCAEGKWGTKMFSVADDSFSNLFIAFNGKSSVKKKWQKKRKEKGTKPEDRKHIYTQ